MESKEEKIERQQKKQTKENRCSGHCCEAFAIDEGALLGDLERSEDKEEIIEISKILNLLISIEDKYYTCKYFDDRTRNCGNYENRPKMCKDYPYGRNCDFLDCTWKSVRLPYETGTLFIKGTAGKKVVRLTVLDCGEESAIRYKLKLYEKIVKLREIGKEKRRIVREEFDL